MKLLVPLAALLLLVAEPTCSAPTQAPSNHSITINSEVIQIPDSIARSLQLENDSALVEDQRYGPIELNFWHKVKHAIDKGLKKLGDTIIDGLAGSIIG
ncbi:Conserved secreted protein [Caenorhabditis elegans]|uniref:Conserved secreted protein n=1 Tax=Caenorhabditis elegans TaxID=6239 RepID=A0A6V7QYG4_CAEEL|nr:Conserved secreted protein [Caenorhabditis elegans]CAD1857020.1 Conserved secreted protein [Caenorhabditis elegans]